MESLQIPHAHDARADNMAPPCCSKAARLAELATMMDLLEQAQLALIEQRPAGGPVGTALREELGTIRGLQARFAADARRCCGLPPDAAREHALAWRW